MSHRLPPIVQPVPVPVSRSRLQWRWRSRTRCRCPGAWAGVPVSSPASRCPLHAGW